MLTAKSVNPDVAISVDAGVSLYPLPRSPRRPVRSPVPLPPSIRSSSPARAPTGTATDQSLFGCINAHPASLQTDAANPSRSPLLFRKEERKLEKS
ncbi:hypothetical protein M0R45_001153 [Rubus argutus]|uniref:Uncharacterized protein n=1 Tax=Rubus argutus TaxID=59490 RepID=A0AAW1VJW0_RUBAR